MLSALIHLAAAVLVVSGADKVRAPRPAGEAMARVGIPTPKGRVGALLPGVALGLAECGAGVWALINPGVASFVTLAAAYLLFAAFVVRLRAVDDTASCGCFGAADTPPTITHAAMNGTAAVVAAVGAIAGGVHPITDVFNDGAAHAVPYVVLIGTATALVLVGPAVVADLQAARAGPASRGVRAFSVDDSHTGGHRQALRTKPRPT